MKRRTFVNVETRHGFKIDSIELDSHRGSMKKFVLNATYPDGRKLWVNVWKRTDVHHAIAQQLEQERRAAQFRACYRASPKNAQFPIDESNEQIRLWDAWAALEVNA